MAEIKAPTECPGRFASFDPRQANGWFRRIPLVVRVPAKVGLLKRERLLSVVGENASSCP